MLRFSARCLVDYKKVAKSIKRAEIKSLSHAAAAIRVYAAKSIRQSPRRRPSAPGSPPHTRKGALRRSILYALLEENGTQTAIVGPSFDLIGLTGKTHEFGGRYKGAEYPARPFMGPALSVIANRLPEFFKGSVQDN